MKCHDKKSLCMNGDHFSIIDHFYNIINALRSAAEQNSNVKKKYRRGQRVVGWNFHVRRSHVKAREKFAMWAGQGRPHSGYFYDNMVASRRGFKAALKYVQRNEERIRMEMLARHRSTCNFVDFWKETKKFNNKNCLPIRNKLVLPKDVIVNFSQFAAPTLAT
ncbi:unnamed protein product [Leptidea sinapis]|uniref:Uncharacterized protein n=1 Tax=Leptidea sinapis TaxID=189913 RepID=A0A5E4PTF5_9NEOP|nr:unnamed protein product [Leptidea sinapis]